jgi:ribosomal protein L18E
MKKQRCLTLDNEVTSEAETKIEKYGGKLSTLIEYLLKKFNKGEIDG